MRDRARRFALQLPLRFRLSGTGRWRGATTENISRTGVIFRTDEATAVDAAIEMLIDMAAVPRRVGAMSTSWLLCQGRVVRVVPADDLAPLPSVAATILNYRLVPGDPPASEP